MKIKNQEKQRAMTSPHILGVVKDFLVLCFLKYVRFLAYESQKTLHLKSSASLQSVNKYSKLDREIFCVHTYGL